MLQLPPQLLSALDGNLQNVPSRIEIRYRPADGRGDLEIGLSATHLETPGGRAGLLFTFQDVTNIKKLERECRDSVAPGGGRRDGRRDRA